jgi:hypothetical protein
MSIGSWDPSASAALEGVPPEPALLQRLIAYSRDDQLTQLAQLVKPDESQQLASLMTLDHTLWQAAAESLSEDELLHLVRFFAVAESLPGCEAGEQSPVIPLGKALRKRGVRLAKTLLQWLREVNDNRFLPYGPL